MTRIVRCIVFLLSLSVLLSATLFAAPSITSLSPTTGAVGASVTITGTNFGSTQGTSTVKFNTTTATTITSWSATSIVTLIPTGATTGSVVVTVGGVASNGKTFTVVAAPSITSLSPTSGAIGAAVTITGTNFTTTKGIVTFNGVSASITSWASTSIKVTVPSGATTGNVVVFASGVNSNGVAFTVLPAPSISSLSPNSGAVGASVTISGSNFGSTQGTGTVTFNGTKATITTWSATSIVTKVPTGATTGNVVVNASGVASNGVSFTVLPTPTISSLSPTTGAVGASVTITGTGFGATQGTGTVTFNGKIATPTSWNATTIVTTVPTGATTGNVVVNTSGVSSNGVKFTVVAAPSITSLSPTSGAVGAAVTITGTNFGSTQGTGTASFNGTPAMVTSWAATSIKVTVPTGATTGNVVVFASGVNSNGVLFTVFPSISGLSPSSAAIGASVTIAGLNFGSTQGSSTVKFNGTAASSITSWSLTSIVATVPTGATSGNVVVTVGGNASNGVAFTVLPTPSVTSVSPNSAAVGASVTVAGSNFGSTQGTGSVKFNGTTATITTWSASSIVATVPTGATSGNVVVNASGVNSNGVTFTVLPTPSISSLSPNSGAVGASLTISGSNFGLTQGTGSVSFNGTAAAVSSWSATSIVTTVPTGATTGNVVVNASGVNTNGVAFTVVAAPSITSVSPTSDAVGASVTIAGSNFGATQGSGSVKFNGTAATSITSWSASSIVAIVPSGATTGNVVVYASGVNSNGVAFTVLPAPSISSLSPTSGIIGTAVTISGSNFGSTQGSGSVTFNGTTASITSWSASSVVAAVPTGATSGNVVVNASGVNSNGVSFTVLQAPNISGVSPTSGPVGALVTITGTNFGATQGSSSVTFNGATATINSWSASSIVATVPTAATTGNIVVTANGLASNGVSFTVLPTPSITGVSPNSATVGASVTITGTNFGASQGSSTVTFNGVAASPSSWSATSIVTPVPTGATTGNVVVTVSGVASNSVLMTVVTSSLPAVVQVQPANGATGVPENGRVVVRLAQAVQPSAIVAGTLALSQGSTNITGTVTLSNDGLSITFAPSQTLSASTTYSVAVTNVAGGQTTPEFQSTFTTGSTTDTTNPTVVQTSPQSGNSIVPTSAPIVAQFTKPMDPATLTPQNFTVYDETAGVYLSGTVQVDPTGTIATFVPPQVLGVGRGFQAYLSPSIQDTEGNSLNGLVFTFTTSFSPDTTQPQLLGISPANGATNVPTNGLIVVGFSKPIDPITLSSGFQVQSSAQTVAGGIAMSNGNQLLTFTPTGGLTANTTYTVNVASQVTDVGGLALSNPATSSFVTGTATNTNTPTVTVMSPAANTTGVPTNSQVQLEFSEPIDPLTVTSATFQISASGASSPAAGTISVSSNGLTATFTPTTPLYPWNSYVVIASNGITDVAGNPLRYFESFFTTGPGADTNSPTVTLVSPANGITGTPINIRVDVNVSTTLNSASVGSGTVTLSAGGVSVPGTVSLSSSGTTLSFAPTSLLSPSTTYTVNVSGAMDEAGNLIVPFTSSFTTGTSTTANTTTPAVSSISPAYGASGVSVGSPIVLTFNEPIDFTTVSTTTVPVSVSGFSGDLAGTYSLDSTGKVLTFTPATPLPANATVQVQISYNGIADLSGNLSSSYYSYFYTGAGSTTTGPTVVSVTPQSGATGIGTNSTVVLTFSESLNAGTVNSSNFGILVNGTPQVPGITISSDNRVVTLTPYSVPGLAAVSILVSNGVTDLYGNPATPFESQYTTGPALSQTAPYVVSQRPGAGATGVPVNGSVVLYLSIPMNTQSVIGALHVAMNGTLVSGTTQVTDNGQVVQFIPSAPFPASQVVQVFLDNTAQGADGVNMNAYQSSFTTAASTATTVPAQIATNPAYGIGNMPTNIVMDMQFNVPLDPGTLNDTSVLCYKNGTWFQSAVSLIDGGTVIQVAPRSPLPANTPVQCYASTSLKGTNGVASYGGSLQLTTGSGPDTVVPTIVTTSPPNGLTNVGDNANIRLTFSKPINPITINSSTIQLSGGGVTVVPDSISFSYNNLMMLLVPHSPLPDNTLMTLTISGVTDVAGNAVAPQTTTFTTGTGPDVVPPLVVWASPLQTNPYVPPTNVPLNAVIQVQTNEPIDPGTVNSNTFLLYDETTSVIQISATYQVSADGRTITLIPSAPLTANHQYYVYALQGMQDLAGNNLSSAVSGVMGNFRFYTGAASNTSAPQVTGISPANGATVPINAQVAVAFNEPINPASLSGLTLSGPGGTVATATTITNGDQLAGLIPIVPLSPSAQYTVNVAGVKDMSGNVLATPATSTFTTGNSADVSSPQVVSTNPASNTSGVSVSSTIQVQFNKPINPLTVLTTTFLVYPSTSIPMPGTISVAANGLSATFTPNLPLDSLTPYTLELTSSITDLEGHTLTDSRYYFTTVQAASEPAPDLITFYPSAANYVGQSVTLEGMYFGPTQGSSTVTFNGVPATPNTWSDVSINVPVPTGATSGPVVVTVNGVASNSLAFTVWLTPSITSINPPAATPGSTVTITGTNFGNSYDATEVQFNEPVYPVPPATIVSYNETSISAIVPANAKTGNFQVTVNGIISNAMMFTVGPNVTQLTPSSGVVGTPVGIYGANFGTSQGSSTVSFNGVPATVTSWSDSYIAVVAPSNVTTGPVTILENSISSNNSAVFTVTTPAIGSLSPPSGAVGASITINGSGLAVPGLTTQVFFNGVAASPYPITANSLTVQVPSNATTGPVTVEVGTVSSNSASFTVEQPPTITSVSPNSGPFVNGTLTPTTISGSGFGATQSNSTINFWTSQTAPSIVSWSDTQIVLWAPIDAGTGPLKVTVGGITATSPSWFYSNRATVLSDSLGNQTNYTFQDQGGQWVTTSSLGPGCVTCAVRGNILNTADANGNILTTTDDLSNTTTYTYDSANDTTSVSKPLNTNTTQTTSYTYNSFGEPLTVTDPLSNVTTNTYDANGNLLTVTTPQPNSNTPASVTQFQYATNGELTQITDPDNNVTKLTYTPAGLIASITDAQNNVTSYQYDARGNRTAVLDPVNGPSHPTSYTYDIMNRLTGITYPDGSTVGFQYDVRGRRTSATDQNNHTTYYGYDDADRLTAVTDPANNVTQYAYDTEDNLLSITDANNHMTQFAYNARGWVTQTTFPSTLQESYTYDLVGNLLSKTNRKNQTIQYVYDALYRLSTKTYPDQTAVEYAYDLASKVLSVNDPTGAYGFAYDNMGRLIGTTTQYAWLSGFNFQNTYAYDAASNRTSLTAPDGSVTLYGYDTLNRLSTLGNSWAGSFGFGYDALSRRTSLTRPNGVNTSYNYDSESHLLSVLHQAGVNTLDGASYTYDPAGNRTSETNYLNGVTSNFGYDLLYELTQVIQGASTTESYSYDGVGNRLSSQGVPTYNYNSSNELTSNLNGSYTYDNNGNTLTDAQGRSYTWDFDNRLTQAVVPGTNGGTATFKYDPFGRRIQKSGPLGTTNYLYDGDDSLEEADNSGNVLAKYTRTKNIDEPLSEIRSGTTGYYEQDGIGSITSLSNGTGALASTNAFDSYGNLNTSTGTLTNPFQYTGREFDPETGLYFYRARYYDPSSGRFINEDPIGFQGGLNFYRYAVNSPLNFRDPTGKNAGTIAIPVGEVICFGSGVCETVIVVGGIVVGTAAVVYWIYQREKTCDKDKKKNCAPCIPPVGTVAYRLDVVPPSKPHFPYTGTHWHLYRMNQNPNNCQCFWQDLGQDGDGPTPPGTVPITPAAGGGFQ